ncbi:MAG: DUF721 domain-containing protein [Geminocystis sp.]|nr:DUF721 domain-containing protein [Geminocystis sp.]HIK37915.1 DUF721 domain-containing protein [Geminocystis sp. M7585_C2015_104]MCS7147055.1 DUF721 domain-containing protein [Geminocystis sp.]MCX8079297.1 DUF721 domain-containing protein [Geminocystis sp.]MDW8115878.1 DUF721 domain-containing protein [Geminocystis sp.]
MGLQDINHLLKKILSQPQWQKQKRNYEVKKAWQETVNHRIAQHTKVLTVRNDVLLVATTSAPWAQQLTLQRQSLLTNINRFLETPIKDIRFTILLWHNFTGTDTTVESEETQNHPSLVNPTEKPTPDPRGPFQQWLETIRKRRAENTICPVCSCYCPPGELQRWGMCAFCFRQQTQKRPPRRKHTGEENPPGVRQCTTENFEI